jgi:hypothetical protein
MVWYLRSEPSFRREAITCCFNDLIEFITWNLLQVKGFIELDFATLSSSRRLRCEGDLKGEKFGTSWLVLRKSVDEYVQETKGMNKFGPRRARH